MKTAGTTRTLLISSALLAATASSGAVRSVTDVEVRDRANATASLAASGRFAGVAWGASTKDNVTDIYFAASRDGGRVFGAPSRVNATPGEANLSGEQPPRVSLLPRAGRDPVVVVVWTAKSSSGTRLWSARSEDGGKSFASPDMVPGTDAAGNRGWESIAANREGKVVALWLDHREMAGAATGTGGTGHQDHQHGSAAAQKDGAARAQLSKVFVGRLDDPASARPLAAGVCYCCKTAMATGANGAIYAAWRNVYPGNIRDIAFAMSPDGGRQFSAPVRVSEDNWVLDGCPENGPALAIDANARIHIVWPTLVPGSTPSSEPTLALFYASSRDGRQFTARQRIPTEGVPRHPQVSVGPRGDVVVAWDEQARGARRVAVARGAVDAVGIARFSRQPVLDDTVAAVYPALAPVEDGTLIAWTSGSSGQSVIRVTRLEK